MTYRPYHPRPRSPQAAYGPYNASASYRRGRTGSPAGPDILFLVLTCLALPLLAALVLGGLVAAPFG